MSKNLIALVSLVAVLPKITLANDVVYSIGTGFPYLLSAEIAYITNAGKRRWYGSYKTGTDSGSSFGMESSVTKDNKHSLGVFWGAVGLKKGESCKPEEESTLTEVLCTLADTFNWESLDGPGITYSYRSNTMSQRGYKIGIGLGYGESRNDVKGVTGQVSFSYQF